MYDPTTTRPPPLEGESEQDLAAFVLFWQRMDLGHVFGFPLWEQEAFEIFHEAFERLSSRLYAPMQQMLLYDDSKPAVQSVRQRECGALLLGRNLMPEER